METHTRTPETTTRPLVSSGASGHLDGRSALDPAQGADAQLAALRRGGETGPGPGTRANGGPTRPHDDRDPVGGGKGALPGTTGRPAAPGSGMGAAPGTATGTGRAGSWAGDGSPRGRLLAFARARASGPPITGAPETSAPETGPPEASPAATGPPEAGAWWWAPVVVAAGACAGASLGYRVGSRLTTGPVGGVGRR